MRNSARIVATIFILAAALCGHAAYAAATNAPPKTSYSDPEGLKAAIRTAVIQLQAGDVKRERVILSAAVVSPAFGQLNPDIQHAAWFLLSAADAAAGDSAEALTHARKATEFKGATALDWHLRFRASLAAQDPTDSVTSLQFIATTWPNTLDQVSDDDILNLLKRSKTLTAPSAGEYDLLNALFDAGWRPTTLYQGQDAYWGRLVLMELDHGNMDRALKVARAIEQHGVLIGMRVDRRFDALVARDPQHFDPARGADAVLAGARQVAADNPDSLTAINNLAEVLLQLGRDEEALKLLDVALARALPPDGSRSDFKDAGEVISTLDSRETALSRLGRFDEAIEALRKASRRPERGQVNVSQAINLGDLLISLGRGSEARSAVADITRRDVSDYGAMAADEVRVCAAVQLGDLGAATMLANEMSKQIDAGFGPYADALYCLGDLDKLAALYIKRLEQADTRTVMLIHMQHYDNDRPKTPFDRLMDDRWEALLKRPDVQDEINRVGRIQSWPFAASGVR